MRSVKTSLVPVLFVLVVLAILAAVLFRVPAPTGAAPGDILPFTATETTLANGLKVIVVPTGFPNLVSIQIPVQVGFDTGRRCISRRLRAGSRQVHYENNL